jgi:hypothetical protein
MDGLLEEAFPRKFQNTTTTRTKTLRGAKSSAPQHTAPARSRYIHPEPPSGTRDQGICVVSGGGSANWCHAFPKAGLPGFI